MRIDEKIDKYLGGLRGFTNKRELAREIEDMDIEVENKDRKKFNAILNPVLRKIDPKGDMDIALIITKLSDSEAIFLYDRLMNLHYK